MSYAPSVFISVLTGQRVNNVVEMAKYVAENRAMRVPTGQLNSLISDAMMMKQPPSDKGKDILCDPGGSQAAALFLQSQFPGPDAFLIFQVYGEQDKGSFRVRGDVAEIRIQRKGRQGR